MAPASAPDAPPTIAPAAADAPVTPNVAASGPATRNGPDAGNHRGRQAEQGTHANARDGTFRDALTSRALGDVVDFDILDALGDDREVVVGQRPSVAGRQWRRQPFQAANTAQLEPSSRLPLQEDVCGPSVSVHDETDAVTRSAHS